MKTIVDTCVWSLALRRQDPNKLALDERQMIAELQEAIRDGRAIIIGPIRQEIFSGIRDKAKFAKTQQLLDPFLDEEIAAEDFVEAARLFNLCRDHGIACGSIDILICAVAARLHYDILTYDQGLKRCIQLLRTRRPSCPELLRAPGVHNKVPPPPWSKESTIPPGIIKVALGFFSPPCQPSGRVRPGC